MREIPPAIGRNKYRDPSQTLCRERRTLEHWIQAQCLHKMPPTRAQGTLVKTRKKTVQEPVRKGVTKETEPPKSKRPKLI